MQGRGCSFQARLGAKEKESGTQPGQGGLPESPGGIGGLRRPHSQERLAGNASEALGLQLGSDRNRAFSAAGAVSVGPESCGPGGQPAQAGAPCPEGIPGSWDPHASSPGPRDTSRSGAPRTRWHRLWEKGCHTQRSPTQLCSLCAHTHWPGVKGRSLLSSPVRLLFTARLCHTHTHTPTHPPAPGTPLHPQDGPAVKSTHWNQRGPNSNPSSVCHLLRDQGKSLLSLSFLISKMGLIFPSLHRMAVD